MNLREPRPPLPGNVRLFFENLLFTLVVPGSFGVWLPIQVARWAGDAVLPPPLWRELLAALPLAAGLVLYSWCLWSFAVVGRGTPAPIDPPRRLVIVGPHHLVRNPMYVGVLTVVLGWAVRYGSPAVLAYGVGLWSMFHLFVVLYEEPTLRRLFGEEFEAYRRSVGRWLPRARPPGG